MRRNIATSKSGHPKLRSRAGEVNPTTEARPDGGNQWGRVINGAVLELMSVGNSIARVAD